jgi:hypothetical protein
LKRKDQNHFLSASQNARKLLSSQDLSQSLVKNVNPLYVFSRVGTLEHYHSLYHPTDDSQQQPHCQALQLSISIYGTRWTAASSAFLEKLSTSSPTNVK